MLTNLRNLLADKSGATAIEYGLIAALVSVAAITALTNMGQSLKGMFETCRSEGRASRGLPIGACAVIGNTIIIA